MKNRISLLASGFVGLLAVAVFTSCDSFSKEDNVYSLSLEGNNLYITMPHPTIGIVGINEVSWRGVDLDELTNDIYTLLKKQHLSDIYSLYVKFEMTSTDKYGNEEKNYRKAFLFEVPVEEVKKYKDSKYFGNSYNLIGKLREAAFTNEDTIGLSPKENASAKFPNDSTSAVTADEDTIVINLDSFESYWRKR